MDVKVIANRIKRGQKYFDAENLKSYEKFRNYLKIQHYSKDKANEDRISVAMIHSLIRTKAPAIYLRNPKYLVTPKRSLTPDNVEQTLNNLENAKAAMDYIPNEIGMRAEMKIARLDYLAFGRAVVKVGFEFEMEESQGKKGIVAQGVDKIKDLVGASHDNPADDEVKILMDRFFVKRVSYPTGGFIYDPESTTGLRGARWCAEEIVRPLQDVKNDKYLENTKDLKSNCQLENSTAEGDQKTDEDRLKYYIYWQKNRFDLVDKFFIVVPDQNITMKEDSNPYEHGDWPYEDCDNYVIPDYLFPVGDIKPIMSQQEELDKSESLLFTHMKTFKQKYKAKRGSLKPKDKTALSTPENNLVEVDELSDLAALENPAVNNTIPLATSTIKDDLTKISGINDYMMASMPSGKTTLGEAQLVSQGSRQRHDESLQDMEDFLKRIGRKLFQVVQQYSTDEMMVRITGDGSKMTDWKVMTPEMIQGEFEVDVEPYSTTPIDEYQQKNEAMMFYKMISSDPTLPYEAKIEALKPVLEAFRIKNTDAFLKPPVPPVMPGSDPNSPTGPGKPPQIMDEQGNVISHVQEDQNNAPTPQG